MKESNIKRKTGGRHRIHIIVPIKSKDDVIGVLRLYSDRQRDFTDDEISLVTALAYQGGLANSKRLSLFKCAG